MLSNFTLLLLVALSIAASIVVVLIAAFLTTRRQSNKRTERLLEDINASSPYRKPEPLLRPHNEKMWDKNLKKEQRQQLENDRSANGQVTKYNPDGLEQNAERDDVQIVGVAEAKGFWSRFVMSQKMGYIMARMGGKKTGQGFWVNLIKAQSASQGKDQSRGR